MAEAPSFFASVYALVAQIPPGFVASYGQLARMLGAPLAARQVGWAMRRCPDELPWQRVIREDGTIAGGEYAPLRRAMLEAEGVPFTQDGRVAIDRCRWQPAEEGCYGLAVQIGAIQPRKGAGAPRHSPDVSLRGRLRPWQSHAAGCIFAGAFL